MYVCVCMYMCEATEGLHTCVRVEYDHVIYVQVHTCMSYAYTYTHMPYTYTYTHACHTRTRTHTHEYMTTHTHVCVLAWTRGCVREIATEIDTRDRHRDRHRDSTEICGSLKKTKKRKQRHTETCYLFACLPFGAHAPGKVNRQWAAPYTF